MRNLGIMFCKILAILVPFLSFGLGCGLDEGSSGEIPRQDTFLEVEGCLGSGPGGGQPLGAVFPASIPFGVQSMDVRLEVFRGEADLVVGVESVPSDFFSFGQGAGIRQIRVGPDSHEPLLPRTWYAEVVSSFGVAETCPEEDTPDWRLTVRRALPFQDLLILDQEGEVPPCTPTRCEAVLLPIEVPEDAVSMVFFLESLLGDVDLFIGLGADRERYGSLNPGTGYDLVVIDPEVCVSLRGQTFPVRLESWLQPSKYRLQIRYVPGEMEAEGTRTM